MFYVIFYGIPVLIFGFWLVSTARFWMAKRANRKRPGSFSGEQMKMRKFWMILSSVLFGILAVFLVAICILIASAIAYM